MFVPEPKVVSSTIDRERKASLMESQLRRQNRRNQGFELM